MGLDYKFRRKYAASLHVFWVPACAGTTDGESSFPLPFPCHSRYPFLVIPATLSLSFPRRRESSGGR
jgi:hypothetical protein